MKELAKNKIVLGLSGGVDSTVAALLLKEKGYEVIGLYFDVLGNNEEGKQSAASVAKQLDIPFVYKDVSAKFKDTIIENFCREYAGGRTPNPCIICNPTVKFPVLLDYANEIGAKYIATGHYATVEEKNGIYYICRGGEEKDQSYMLYRLGQNVLSRLIFPLGTFAHKEDTRNVARTHHLTNAEQADSQEICFIDDSKEDYKQYLSRHGYSSPPGNFVDESGQILGKHRGIINYTVGQRKGLGITLGKPAFVTAIDSKNNTVVLGDGKKLFSNEVLSAENVFTNPNWAKGKRRVFAKIRYASKPSPATISIGDDGFVKTIFDDPQRAATPGQSIVFYQDNLVVGGGFIFG